MTVGITTRKTTVKQEDFHKRIADAVFSPHNSFAGKVLAHYKVLSEKEGKNFLETKEGCPFRDFASGLLKAKARVTEEQIAQLTNKQLEEFVAMYCDTGDASGIKDLVDATIEEQKEQPVNVEKKAEPPANGGNAYININEI